MRSSTAALATLLTAALAALTATSGTALLFNDICVRTTDWNKRAPGALRKGGVDYALWLVWSEDADRASAALLLRRLAEHPRCQTLTCRLALCHSPGGLCDLLTNTQPEDGLDTAFVAGVQPFSAMSCPYNKRYLSAVGSNILPLRAREHVVLAPAAAALPACLAAVEPAFHSSSNEAELRACHFEPGAPDRTARSAVELRALVAAGGGDSFRFRDAELWADEPRVLPLRDVRFSPALLVAEEVNLLMHAPWALDVLREHAPPGRALRDLLAREAADASASGAERGQAAVDAAAAAPAADAPPSFEAATPTQRYRALVCLCEEDERGPDAATERRDAIREILEDITRSTAPHRVHVQVELYMVPCRDREALGTMLQSTLGGGGAHRILGAVAAGVGAEEAARSTREVPVVTYDTQAEGGGTLQVGARATEVAATLSAVLAGCGWRRVAVLSEESSVSARIAEELSVEGPVRRASLSDVEEELRVTLRRLVEEEARVVVVNAGGWVTARTLRLAVEEGLAGCAWVVREWTAASPPPVPLVALRAAPRSAAELGAVDGRDAGAVLTRRWRGRRWPAPLVPLTEALLTLTLGYARLFTAREELRYDHVAMDMVESLRWTLRNETLPGVARNLTFDEHGARMRPLLLELWKPGEDTPRELTLDLLPASCPVTAPAAPRCRLPAGGDAFQPAVCLELACAVGTPALLLAVLLAGYGAAALRRCMAARARSRLMVLRAEAGAALLARQRHTGAELRALLVERERVTLLRALGAGRHGRVWLARLAPRGLRLAAKGPHAGAAPAEEGELLREAGALAPLRHAHVVRLLGVCVGPGPPLLLTSVAENGDLLRYLRARRPPAGGADEAAHVSAPALTRLAREAALALGYLASRGIVHRDVRAANCLLDERRSLKLADFGMARSLGDSPESGGARAAAGEYYACRRRALFPVLWMAPESLSRGAFSCASDVWSLGVLALELVSLGARPFGSLSAAEAVTLVERGGHARLPGDTTADTRRLARSCWRREADARPTATEVAAWLETRPEALTPCPDAASGVDALDADSGMDEPDVS